MSNLCGQNYRVRGRRTSASAGRIAARVIAAAVLVCCIGCTGFADEVRHSGGDESNAEETMAAATGLYEAMVEVFREETEGIDRASEETLTVVSHYEAVPEQRRRRFVGRVVPLDRGIGVRITAEYQSDVAAAGQKPDWEDQPRDLIEHEASPDELQLARKVERTYHRDAR